MKGDITFFLFLSLLMISLVSAAPELNFQHNQTQPGETILATITTTGEFTKDIEESDIQFLEGRKNVFFEYDLTYFNGTYYFYAYTTREGNFTLKISNILYREDGNLKSTTLEKDFTVQEEPIIEDNLTRTEILTIKPGFIRSSEVLELTFTNKGDSTINITCLEEEISLEPLESKKINFEQEEQFATFYCDAYKEFLIPVIRPEPNETIIPPTTHDLKSDLEQISLNITIGDPINTEIELFNFGDDNLTDFKLSSDFGFIELGNLEDFQGRDIQNLSIKISPELPGHFQGKINLTYLHLNKSKTLFIPVDFFILPKGSNTTSFRLSNLSCAELNGNVCNSGTQICDGTAEFTDLGEYCCPGTCIDKPSAGEDGEGFGFGWVIGLLIFAALGALGYYLYKKQKKIVPKNPEEQMKQTSEKMDERLKGIKEPKRVSGALQRT